MKQIKSILFGLIFIICSLNFNIAKAEEEKRPMFPPLTPQQMPIYCGETNMVFETAEKVFKQVPIISGEVINIRGNGQVVGLLTIVMNGNKDLSVLMTVLEAGTTCIMGYGQDLKFYNEFKDYEPPARTDNLSFENGVMLGWPIKF